MLRKPVSSLDAETRNYLREVATTLENAGEGFEGREDVIDGAMEGIKGKEFDVMVDSRAGRVFEGLVGYFGMRHVAMLLERIRERFYELCADGCASHVLERLLARTAEGDDAAVTEQLGVLVDNTDSTGSWLGMARDSKATHVVRAILKALAAVPGRRALLHKAAGSVVAEALGAGEENEVVETLCQTQVSATLQEVLQCLQSDQPAYSDAVVRKFVQSVGSVQDLVRDAGGSRLVEKLVSCAATAEGFATMFLTWFRGNVATFSQDAFANHVVQALLTSPSSTPAEISLAVTELLPIMQKLLSSSDRCGVAMAAAEACAKHGVLEKEVSDIAVGGGETPDKKVAEAVLRSPKPGYVRSRLAQALLKMRGEVARPFVASLSSLPVDGWLLPLARDSSGSRVLEAALDCPTITRQTRVHLVGKLKGKFAETVLGGGVCAAKVVECCYKHGDVHLKETIAGELAKREAELKNDRGGQFVLRSCKVALFNQKREDWRAGVAQSSKKREMFADILAEDQGESGKGTPHKSPASADEQPRRSKVEEQRYAEFMAKLGFGPAPATKLAPVSSKEKKPKAPNTTPVATTEIDELFEGDKKHGATIDSADPAEQRDETEEAVLPVPPPSKPSKKRKNSQPAAQSVGAVVVQMLGEQQAATEATKKKKKTTTKTNDPQPVEEPRKKKTRLNND